MKIRTLITKIKSWFTPRLKWTYYNTDDGTYRARAYSNHMHFELQYEEDAHLPYEDGTPDDYGLRIKFDNEPYPEIVLSFLTYEQAIELANQCNSDPTKVKTKPLFLLPSKKTSG